MPTYVTKNKFFFPSETYWQSEKLTEKDEKKLVTDVSKNPKVSLEKVRVHFSSFSAKESISRQTVRKIFKTHGIKSRLQLKSYF